MITYHTMVKHYLNSCRRVVRVDSDFADGTLEIVTRGYFYLELLLILINVIQFLAKIMKRKPLVWATNAASMHLKSITTRTHTMVLNSISHDAHKKHLL